MPVWTKPISLEKMTQAAANFYGRREDQVAAGLEINANHIRSVSKGWLYATARPIHVGGSTQVWEIRIEHEDDKTACISRITMAVMDAR
jgi:uncharacterized protein (TIGR00369 family)